MVSSSVFSICCLLVLVVLPASVTEAKGLTLLIKGYDQECLFLPKTKDKTLDFVVLSGGSKIDFYLFEPNEHHPNMERYGVKEFEQYKLKVNVTGDHKFCFSNIYQSHAINVAFEYELFEESEEAETSLQKDVRAFYDNVQDQLHEMFKEEGFKEKHEVVQNFLMTNLLKKNKEEIYAHKSTDEKLKGSMAWVSFNIERMSSALMVHQHRMGRHYFLQKINGERVMQYSILISLAMVISTCIQLVVVKGFFNGKWSLNVFSYK